MKNFIALMLLTSGVFATDFSQMCIDRLISMRESVSKADRSAFEEEIQKRIQDMTPEERKKYKGMRGQGMGMGRNCMKNQPTFAEYDLNNDGAITQKELEEARKKRMSQKTKEGKILRNTGNAPSFASMDKNSDGILNQEEFRLHQGEYMHMKSKGNCAPDNCPDRCKEKSTRSGKNRGNTPVFSDIDTNNDGMISKEEFTIHQSQRMNN